MEEFFYADCKSILVQFNHEEKQLKLKRRWLAGLPLSRDERRQLMGPKSDNDRTLPESLLREDDVYYETIRTLVEKGVGLCNAQREQVVQDNVQHFPSPNNIETILSLLDDMTNIALFHLAEILTGGSIKFKKTRSKLKKIAKEYLPKVLRNQNDNYNMNIYAQLSKLLKDPQNFRRTLCTSASQSHCAAAVKILDRLEDFPTQALCAMHRRLIGIEGYAPQLQPTKRGLRRDVLIQKVREFCMEMLSELDEEDELQEPLAEAMTVASLTLKLILGCYTATDFKQFSADIEFLQNEIAKAIWLLNQKGRFAELRNLQLLLDPNAKLSNKKLQLAVKRLLTEYLFECGDLENIPRWLLETLAIVNKSSQSSSCRYFSMEEMQEYTSKDVEEEVECILSVSALTRQIVWDLFPDHGFDQDFADAYIEELEESDNGDSCDEVEISKHDSRFYSNESKDQIESIGETNPAKLTVSPAPRTEGDGCSPVFAPNRRLEVKLESVDVKIESMDEAEMDSVDSYPSASSSSCLEPKDLDSPESMHGSQFQLGALGPTDFHSKTWTANHRGPSPSFSADGKSNGNYTKTREPSIDSAKTPESGTSNFSCGELNFMHDEQSMIRNQYLGIQEASDETSVVAYRIIGRLLENFAHRDGMDLNTGAISYLRDSDPSPKNSKVTEEEWTSCEEGDCGSVLAQVVEELIPSFPKSGREKLKELLGLN